MESKWLKLGGVEPRKYQLEIAEKASQKNTLVVIPTGMGKTLIAVLIAVKRLEKYPDSKILITAPTRPLNAQHKKTFEQTTFIDPAEIVLVTGKINPDEREKIYKSARVVIATPQTVENDLENKKISLEDFSFIVFDEAHRCVKDYSYTQLAREYKKQSRNPLILGLTASPGGTEEKISEIRKNLFIEQVEIRTESDTGVQEYVQPVQMDWIYVEFPDEFKMVKGFFEDILKDSLFWLKEHHFLSTYKPSLKLLLALQARIGAKYTGGGKGFALMWAMMRAAEAIKLEHAIELLETQGIYSLIEYMNKIAKSSKRTDAKIAKDPRFQEAYKLVENLHNQKVDHPKILKLIEIVKNFVSEKKNVKIIIFANYRSTVEKIRNSLKNEGISSEILIGQTMKEGKGLTQEKQIEVIKSFGSGEFNVLVASSIGEEGLDIISTDLAIFYEAVPSEIRMIQRRGRVGRQEAGKVIFLLTKGTRDEAYFFSALRKEKKMKKVLYELKNKTRKENLRDWVS